MIVRFYPNKTVVRNDGFRLITDDEGNGIPEFNVARESGRKAMSLYLRLGATPKMMKAVYKPR